MSLQIDYKIIGQTKSEFGDDVFVERVILDGADIFSSDIVGGGDGMGNLVDYKLIREVDMASSTE